VEAVERSNLRRTDADLLSERFLAFFDLAGEKEDESEFFAETVASCVSVFDDSGGIVEALLEKGLSRKGLRGISEIELLRIEQISSFTAIQLRKAFGLSLTGLAVDALPESIEEFPGNVWMSNLNELNGLPPKLRRVRGDLTISACESLKVIPEGLVIEGSLEIQGCNALKRLSKLEVGRHFSIQGCESLEQLYEVNISGNSTLARLPSVVQVPQSLRTGVNLRILDCRTLTAFPSQIVFNGGLDLSGCINIRQLPKDLHVRGDLILQSCVALAKLPNGLRVDGDLVGGRGLFSSQSLNLVGLPDGLWVGKSLNLYGCTFLQSLGNRLRVDGNVDIQYCTSLRDLGTNGIIGGNLNARFCTQLSVIPSIANLQVGRNLLLEGCNGLGSIEEGAVTFGEAISLEGCHLIENLPNDLLNQPNRQDGRPREFYVSGSGVDADDLAVRSSSDNRFHVSLQAVSESTVSSSQFMEGFITLTEALEFWRDVAKEPGFDAELEVFVPEAYKRGTILFFSKLRHAKEFGYEEFREGLAKRVLELMELLCGNLNSIREELLIRITDSTDTCHDKPIHALNQIQVLLEITKARGDREKLKVLGMRIMRLNVVHEHVRRKLDALKIVDDVCVFLRFEIEAREQLDLPVSATQMHFPNYVKITDDEIEAAIADAASLTKDDLEFWLPSWSEWQRQLRLELVQSIQFHKLPRNSLPRRKSFRDVLGREAWDPVRLPGSNAVFSLSDLLKKWIEDGTDLNNVAVTLEDMKGITRCA